MHLKPKLHDNDGNHMVINIWNYKYLCYRKRPVGSSNNNIF